MPVYLYMIHAENDLIFPTGATDLEEQRTFVSQRTFSLGSSDLSQERIVTPDIRQTTDNDLGSN